MALHSRFQTWLVQCVSVLGASLLLLSVLEVLSRIFEQSHPTPKMEVWTPDWRDHFYTLKADDLLWPPGRPVNRDGVHDRSHPIEKGQDTSRLVFLGDSVTAGFGINPEEAYPRVLQARLDEEGRRIEVLNVSVEGWSTSQERIAYERIARRYHPDQVIVAICLNDILELENAFLPAPRWLVWLHRSSALVRRVVSAQAREEDAVRKLFRPGRSFELLFEQLRGLEREVRADGASIAVIVFPFRFQVKPGAPPPTVQKSISEFCVATAIPCMDLLPVLSRNGESMFIDYDHLSPAGSRVVAEAILRSGILVGGSSFLPQLSSRLVRAGPMGASALAWIERRQEVPPAEAIGPLIDSLNDRDGRVRTAAASALGWMGPSAVAALPALAKALRDPEERVRSSAAQAMAHFGPAVTKNVPELLEALGDQKASVRWAAAETLWKCGGVSQEDVPKLVQVLKSDDDYVRAFSVWALGSLGLAAGPAVPALMDLLKDDVSGLKGPATALKKIGVSRVLAPLIVALKSEDSMRRRNAALVLGEIGPEARDSVPDLVVALQDPDEQVASSAAAALGDIRERPSQSVPVLVTALREGRPSVRVEAARALGKIRPEQPMVIRALATALSEPNPELRAVAARALGRIGRAAAMTVPSLRAMKGDPDEDVQAAASWALEQIG